MINFLRFGMSRKGPCSAFVESKSPHPKYSEHEGTSFIWYSLEPIDVRILLGGVSNRMNLRSPVTKYP